jgi:Ca2+-binding RTX toxin-like protein
MPASSDPKRANRLKWMSRRGRARSRNRWAFTLTPEPLLETRQLMTTLVVTTTADTGIGSLRNVITQANSLGGSNTIDFSIGSGQQTITLASVLPDITSQVLIDGTSQPGFSGTPLIQIDGSGLGGNISGLTLDSGASGSTIKDLIISDFSGNAYGIFVNGANSTTIQGNWIGLNTSGTAAAANGSGIQLLNSSGDLIGTNGDGVNDTAEGNVISGNTTDGVLIFQSSNNTVAGNDIGTDVTGTTGVPNGFWGVEIDKGGSSSDNDIVGTNGSNDAFNADERNIISGNASGVTSDGANTTIAGNWIGVNVNGAALVNGAVGSAAIEVSGTGGVIGTNDDGIADATERNVIDSGGLWGVYDHAPGSVIAGNFIGTDPTGTIALSSADQGIDLGSDVTVGGTDAIQRNIIAGFTYGIHLDGSANDAILGNFIGTNATGTAALPNTYGVYLFDNANSNIVGGASVGSANVISGNSNAGVLVDGAGTINNTLLNNLIGVASDQVTGLPNGGGALTITNNAVVRAGGTFTGDVSDGGTLDLHGNNVSIVGGLNGAGTVNNNATSGGATLTINGTGTFSGSIADGGAATTALTIAGGTETLTGSNGYSGATTITAGTLQVGSGGTTGSIGSGAVIDNGTLFYNLSSGINVTNAISGSGTLNLRSTGGAITQSIGITVADLVASAATGITLMAAGNTLSGFTATNSASGAIDLTNVSSSLIVSGITNSGSTNGSNVGISQSLDLTISGAISTTAAANNSIVLQASGPLFIDAGVSAAGSGVVMLSGTGTGNTPGVAINGATVQSSTGTVTINGTGGGAGSNNYGVVIEAGGVVRSTGASAQISITGIGGNSSGGPFNDGVEITGAGSLVTTAGANVSLRGTGGTSSSDNYGIRVAAGGEVTAGGNGTVMFNGTGGVVGGDENGVVVTDSGSLVTSSGGTVTILGQGGGFTPDSADSGIVVQSGAVVSSGGTGTLVVQGTSGPSSGGSNLGVLVSGATITSSGGNVAVTGNASAGGGEVNNVGVRIDSAGIVTAGGTGGVFVNGTASSETGGTLTDFGVFVTDSGSQITSTGGDISITGQGGGGTIYGVSVDTNASVTAPGSHSVTLTGTNSTYGGIKIAGSVGSTSGAVNLTAANRIDESAGGVVSTSGTLTTSTATGQTLTGANAVGTFHATNTASGAISLTNTSTTLTVTGIAQGGTVAGSDVTINQAGNLSVTGAISTTAAASGNIGLTTTGGMTLTAGVTAGGAGNLTLTANQTGATAGSFAGILINGVTVQSATGTILVQGTAGSGGGGDGVLVENGGKIQTTGGTGTVTVHGTGGSSTNGGEEGVVILGSGVVVTSGGGNVSIIGQAGGSGAAAANIGVVVNTGVQVTAGGGGTVTIQGNGGGVGTNNNWGVEVSGTVTSSGGGVTITGVGGGSGGGASNAGIIVDGQVTAGGSGAVSLTGNGDTGNGVVVNGSVTSTGGDISVTSVINTLIVNTGGSVIAPGANSVTLTASSGGISIQGTVSSTSGDLSATSTSFIVASGGGLVSTTGAGIITLNSSSIGTSGSTPFAVSGNFLNSTTSGNGNQFLSTTGSTTIGSTGLSAGTGTVELDGGTFALGSSNQINNSTKLNVNGATFAIGTFSETVATVTLTSGSITGSTGVLTSTSTIQTKSGTISASLGGTNGLTQSTAGTTTLSGTSAYTGTTTISGGTLLVDGSITSAVNVSAAGTLGGSGSVGAVNNAGVVSPGDSPGILTINGGYTQTGSLTDEIQGVTPGQFDQLAVNGTVVLSGALNPSLLNAFLPAKGSSFTLINNDGSDSVTGSFTGLPQGAEFNVGPRFFTISYVGGTGNDVVISAIGLAVTNTSDSGAGSLRQAILNADAGSGGDEIDFGIPGSGVQTISPLSALPIITESVTVDGPSQPGFAGSPLIQIDGTAASAVVGLTFGAGSDGSTVLGLIISDFSGGGINLSSNHNVVEGNWIGTDLTGVAAATDAGGVTIGGTANTIGGTTAASRNIISGNTVAGVVITGAGASSNVVEGNYIGTDKTGTQALPNTIGVWVLDGASGNTIGGSTAAARNVISGNSNTGVEFDAPGNTLQGNFIGVDESGNAALGNNGPGLVIQSVSETIGGPSVSPGAAPGNVISANLNMGIFIYNAGTGVGTIQGNIVGLGADGSTALGNGGNDGGIYVALASLGLTIGGPVAADRNVISANSRFGIITDPGATGLVIQGNYIGTDVTGTLDRGNTEFGIYAAAPGTLIGGLTSTPGTAPGNVVSGNGTALGNGTGIAVVGDSGIVEGNIAGLDRTGTTVLPGNVQGEGIATQYGSNTTIGGTALGALNLVSGNTGAGINLASPGGIDTVAGNLIGTDITGTIAVGNQYGFLVTASGNTIGGTTALSRNVISGNTNLGVEVLNPTAFGNVIEGNYIGVGVNGTTAFTNQTFGVHIDGGAHDNVVGGLSVQARNVISGNTVDGVAIIGAGTTFNIVEGNFIGIDRTGNVAVANTQHGVEIYQASGNTVGGNVAGAGNVVSGNGVDGVVVQNGSSLNTVAGNFVGTNSAGTVAIPNGQDGVEIALNSTGNVIGGTVAAARNLISGNTLSGVDLALAGVSGNQVEGNYIGTDVTGLLRLANGANGVIVQGGPSGNTIGGLTATAGLGAGNVISGNTSANIAITGQIADADSNTVAGNLIGTNATGLGSITSGADGVEIYQATNNVIGGTLAGARNVISANARYGVSLFQSATGNLVEGNFIGTDLAGTAALGNIVGVFLDTNSSNNTIGGVGTGAANTIAFNSADGVQVNAGDNNPIRGNAIYANLRLGIELGSTGVPLQNVLGGSTSGPNLDENYPVLDSVAFAPGSGTTILGDINTTPNTTVFVDFYANPGVVLPAYGQGQVYLGATMVTTGVDGGAQFTFNAPALAQGAIVSATATDAAGNTSEFGLDFAEDSPPSAAMVTRVGSTAAATFNVGQTIKFDGSASSSPDGYPLSYSWDFGDHAIATGQTATHAFAFDGTYVATLTVNDGHGGIESTTETLTIDRVPLAVAFNALPASIAVGTPLTVAGTVTDAAFNPVTLKLGWGDGSPPLTLHLPAGTTTFSTSHTFTSLVAGGSAGITVAASDAPNPAATPPEAPLVPLTTSTPFDVGGSTGQASTSINVVPPPISVSDLNLSSTSIHENDSVTLSGTIVDAFPLAAHTVTISWGDAPSSITTLALNPGALGFSVSHPYLNNPTGVPSGAFPISVTVTNNHGQTGSAATAVTVSNVAPTVTIQALAPTGSTSLVSLFASVTDPGTLDPHNYQWSVNGTSVASATQPSFTFNPKDFPPASGGVYLVAVSVSDDVGASAQASTSLLIGPATSGHTILLSPGGVGQVAETIDSQPAGTFTPGNTVFFYTGSTNNRVTIDPTLTLPAELVSTPGGTNTLVAGSGNDTLLSAQGEDTLIGTTGNTTFVLVLSGHDPVVQGSTGINTIDLSQTPQDVTLNLGVTTPQVVDGGGDVIQLASGTFQKAVAGPGNETLYAANGVSTTLVGGAGNDLLFGGTTSNSSIVGGSGNATMVGGGGNSIIYGSTSGSSSIVGGSGNATVVGGGGNSIIYGTTGGGSTSVVGGSGNATVVGGGGNSIIYGSSGSGSTSVMGGSGNTTVVGGGGNSVNFGSSGSNPTVVGGSGNTTVVGGGGNSIIYGSGSGSTSVVGGSGNSTVVGGGGNSIIYGSTGGGTTSVVGGSGNTTVVGAGGNSIIYGSTGSGGTSVVGGSGNTTVVGGGGNSINFGSTGSNPTVVGGSGNTTVVGGGGNSIIYGSGTGNTSVVGGSGNSTVVGGGGNSIIYGTGSGSTSVVGGSGNATVVGGGGNSIVYGSTGSGSTSVVGGSGNTTVVGGGGNSINFGSSGSNPTVVGGSGNTTVVGGGGNSIIYGSGSGSTSVVGGSGNSTVVGGGGNSIIYGSSGGTTSVIGGSGNTTVVGGGGNSIVYGSIGGGGTSVVGGSGNTTVVGGGGNSINFGSSGSNPTVVGGTGNTTVVGGGGNSIVYGSGSGGTSVVGGSGNTTVVGGGGNSIIYGSTGSGSTSVVGGSGNTTVIGGGGNSINFGSSGSNPTVVGGSGNTTVVGGGGNSIIYGSGTGSTSVVGGSGNTTVVGGGGNSIIFGSTTGTSSLIGGSGNSTIVGGGGNSIIYGGTGNDSLVAGSGQSTMRGGGGTDILQGNARASLIEQVPASGGALTSVTLTNGSFVVAGYESETIAGFGQVAVSLGGGQFLLDASQTTHPVALIGGAGSDTILAGSGNDSIYAGTGTDSLVGGLGHDTYVFGHNAQGGVTINNANDAGDSLDFSQFGGGIDLDLEKAGPQVVSPGLLTLTITNPPAVKQVLGTAYPDTIMGNGGGDTLVGNGGDDYLDGRGGGALIEGAETQVVFLNFLPGAVDYSSQTIRDAIESRIAAIYGDFNYTFTQAAPTSGLYAEIDFNVPAGTYLGGEATELDWRNLDLGGSATVDISQFLQFPGLVGVAGLPAATTQNIINMSATIAAHELGHLSGLLHEDAFGPIGTGVSTALLDNPNLDGFYPAYGGPSGATETPYDVMASPASVGSSLYDATRVTFLGERDAIKLAFADSGTTVVEATGTNSSTATAQALALTPISVPNTLLVGQDLGTTFDVTAVDVNGAITLGADGKSSVDYYSFTATAGQLFNFEALSQTITRDNGDDIDPVLTLFEADGKTVVPYGTFENGTFVPFADNAVASDDDSFQDQDSILYDVTMPYTGTYYVQVKTFVPIDQFNIAQNSGVGRYELFAYSFAATSPAVSAFADLSTGNGTEPTAPGTGPATMDGDTLIGGSGHDTLIGSSASDLIAIASGDMVQGGSGPDLIDDLPAGLSVTGGPLALTGSFVASNAAVSYTTTWHVTANNGLAFSDVSQSYAAGQLSAAAATPVSFSLPSSTAGIYNVTFTVTDGLGISRSVTTTETVGAPLTVSIAQGGTHITGPILTKLGTTITLNATGGSTYAWTATLAGASTPEATGNAPAFSFSPQSSGTYTVSVVASDTLGDHALATATIIVATPSVQIVGVPANLYEAEGSPFTLSSLVTNAPVNSSLAWTIAVGSGPASAPVTTSSFTYTPPDIGSYTVTLSLLDGSGHALAVTSQQLIGIGVAPVANISGGPSGGTSPEGTALGFSATASSPSPPTMANGFYYEWTVMYGNVIYTTTTTTTRTTAPSPFSFTPGQAGTYVVHLSAIDYHGYQGQDATQTVRVTAVPPTVAITGVPANSTAVVGSTIGLGASVTAVTTALQNAGFVDTWSIAFGGTTYGPYFGPSLNLTANGVGTYAITLTAQDAEGLSNSTTVSVNVTDTAPQVIPAAATEAGTQGVSTSFTLGSVTGPGLAFGAGTVLVNWGDNTSSSYSIASPGNLPAAAHAYGRPGSFPVTVSVRDAFGLVGTGTFTAAVAGVAPAPSILGVPSSVIAGTTVTLGSSVSDASLVEAGFGFSYSWSVTKDGSAYTMPGNPATNLTSFTFEPTLAGAFVVTLAVTDHDNQTGRGTASFTVLRSVPVVNVTASNGTYNGSPFTGSPVTTVNGNVTTTGVTYAYTLLGSTTAIPAPTHAGSYTVTANYAGSDQYVPGSASTNFTINPAATSVTGSTASTSFGSTTLKATVTSSGGTPAGSVDFYDSTTMIDFGSASLNSAGTATLNLSVPLEAGSQSIVLTFTSSTSDFSGTSATIGVNQKASVYVLNTTAAAALSVSGSSNVTVPGTIQVASSSSQAVVLSGSSKLTAASIGLFGGSSVSGSSSFGVTPTKDTTAPTDPLASLPIPSAVGMTTHAAVNLGGSSSLTIAPGIYPSISVSGSGKLTLQPGIYVITGGGFSVSGAGTATGSGVMIYNAGSNFGGGSGNTFGAFALSGSGVLNLTAPTTGIYAGILVFQSRDNSHAMSVGGAAVTGLGGGTIYAPAATLSLSGSTQVGGSGQASSTLIVNELTLSGATGAYQLTDGASSDTAISTFNWITSPVLTVAAEDDTGAGLDPNKVADLGNAMAYLNQALASFGVNLSWAAAGTTADVTVHFATTTPEGGVPDGVLGYTTAQNDVYFVAGWNYSTSTDPTQVAPDQFDFLTLAIHELGHTIGLGESQDPNSVMYEYLAPGTVRRDFTDSNLALIDTDADRFMKVATGLPATAGVSGPITSSAIAPLPLQGIGAVPTLVAPLDDLGLARDLLTEPAVQRSPVVANPTSIRALEPNGRYFRRALLSKPRVASRAKQADRNASDRSIRVDTGFVSEASLQVDSSQPGVIDLALEQMGDERTPTATAAPAANRTRRA